MGLAHQAVRLGTQKSAVPAHNIRKLYPILRQQILLMSRVFGRYVLKCAMRGPICSFGGLVLYLVLSYLLFLIVTLLGPWGGRIVWPR